MKLRNIEYELYESEYDYVSNMSNSKLNELDREIKLEFDNGKIIYIYWTDEPVQFCVGFGENRSYITKPEKTIETTKWKLWAPFIGTNIDIKYTEKDHEMIELSNENHSLFLWAGGENGSDTLCVSSEKP